MSEVADSTEARSQSLNPLFTEHSNTDKMKKRRTVADSVANVGESGDRDSCLGTSAAWTESIPDAIYLHRMRFRCIRDVILYMVSLILLSVIIA